MVGRRGWGGGVALGLTLGLAGTAAAQGPPAAGGAGGAGGAGAMFEKQCYSCHNIGGGDKKGPDLMGLLQRRNRAWVHRFVPSAVSMRNAGDPTAVQLFSRFKPEEMTDQTLSPDQLDQILGLIEQCTKSKKPFVPTTGRLYRRPRPADIPAGRRLFTGQTRLASGGPACIACHSTADIGFLGGGALGPDLTNVNRKYTEVELASILKAPAFPTMSKLFATHTLTNEEAVRLFAYLQSEKMQTPNPPLSASRYLSISVAGVLAVFGLMSFTWRGRLRGVRRQLRKSER